MGGENEGRDKQEDIKDRGYWVKRGKGRESICHQCGVLDKILDIPLEKLERGSYRCFCCKKPIDIV